MNKRDIVILSLRLLGIYLFLAGLSTFSGLIVNIFEPVSERWDFFVAPIPFLVGGAFLYLKAPFLSRFILNYDVLNENNNSSVRSDEIIYIALQIMGIYILANALPPFFDIFVNSVAYSIRITAVPESIRMKKQSWSYIVDPSIRIVIGLFLLFGKNNIIKFIKKTRRTY